VYVAFQPRWADRPSRIRARRPRCTSPDGSPRKIEERYRPRVAGTVIREERARLIHRSSDFLLRLFFNQIVFFFCDYYSQRTNLDVNLAVNNLLSRDDEENDGDHEVDSYVSDVSISVGTEHMHQFLVSWTSTTVLMRTVVHLACRANL
jgi:hypothetical protein